MEPRRRFKFIRELAQGGFGKVYLAEQLTGENFSSVVAIKLLHGTWVTNNEVVMRSRDEARLLGRLRHRNIVRVEDLTSINGQCAIVMEYLQGVDLKAVCVALREQNKPFPRKSVFESASAIAAALDAAYTHKPLQGGDALQVIHRDIKPSNAMITVEGDVKVLDFGTARASFENREAKTQMLAFGSQAYMAPERMLGEADAPSGDVFSLGVTLYEMLTLDSFGKIPLRQERFEPTVSARINGLDLTDMSSKLADATRSGLRKLLAYDHEARPSASDALELMDELADMASDAGLKRFAREVVKKIYEQQTPQQDPNDPYVGNEIKEDRTGATDGLPKETTGPLDPKATFDGSANYGSANLPSGDLGVPESSRAPSASGAHSTVPAHAEPTDGGDEFQAPPELSEPAVDLPGSRPAASASAPAAFASPPAPPRGVTSFVPAMPGSAGSGGSLSEASVSGASGAGAVGEVSSSANRSISGSLARSATSDSLARSAPPGGETRSAPRPRPNGSVSGATSAPTLASGARPIENAPASAPGGSGKILVALGVVGVLGLAAAGGLWLLFWNGTPAPTTPTITPLVVSADLPKGTPDLDWAANGAGKGGAILRVPDGAVEVGITSSTGFRQEWDGSMNLRLRDLEPGRFRTKVKLSSGSSQLSDFAVDAGSTCLFTLKGDHWEKGECR